MRVRTEGRALTRGQQVIDVQEVAKEIVGSIDPAAGKGSQHMFGLLPSAGMPRTLRSECYDGPKPSMAPKDRERRNS